MKIALIGYGKMGKAIETIALKRGHSVVLKINDENLDQFTKDNLAEADVAIEFTGPESALRNVRQLIEWKLPTVCGSTGWIEELPRVEEEVTNSNASFIYASNFSVGVNLFFELTDKLASLMAGREDYRASMEEIHHTAKKDAPSGTAISLADRILAREARLARWVNEATDEQVVLPIVSKREDPAPGTHSIKYSSEVDDIEIIHTAHSRDGFATGAVLAAEFIHDKKGIFSMKEVLGI